MSFVGRISPTHKRIKTHNFTLIFKLIYYKLLSSIKKTKDIIYTKLFVQNQIFLSFSKHYFRLILTYFL